MNDQLIIIVSLTLISGLAWLYFWLDYFGGVKYIKKRFSNLKFHVLVLKATVKYHYYQYAKRKAYNHEVKKRKWIERMTDSIIDYHDHSRDLAEFHSDKYDEILERLPHVHRLMELDLEKEAMVKREVA